MKLAPLYHFNIIHQRILVKMMIKKVYRLSNIIISLFLMFNKKKYCLSSKVNEFD